MQNKKIFILIALGLVSVFLLVIFNLDKEGLNKSEHTTGTTMPVKPNIVKEKKDDGLIKEDGINRFYAGIVSSIKVFEKDSKIFVTVYPNFDSNGFLEIRGDIDNVFLEEGGALKKISLLEINELRSWVNDVLSIMVVEKKEVSLIEKIKHYFGKTVFAHSWYVIKKIEDPEKIIFQKPLRKNVIVVGKIYRDSNYLLIEPEGNQGVNVEKEGEEGKDTLVVRVIPPEMYFMKFKNNPEYFGISEDNFAYLPLLMEAVVVEGEERCPGFNMPCLIKAEKVKIDVGLSKDSFEKGDIALNTSVSWLKCENGQCRFLLEGLGGFDKRQDEIKDIQEGSKVAVKFNISCPPLINIIEGKNSLRECDFSLYDIKFIK